jgi:simple sugar transport system permease protein
MRLFNIGAEGQLYLGAIFGAAAGLYLGDGGGTSWLTIAAMVLCGALGGALWALIPGVLRAFYRTNEIITSLMLNYVAGYLLTYLIFESESYWRDTTGFNATVFPAGKQLPSSAIWPAWTVHIQGGTAIPLGLFIGIGVAVGLWFLYQRTRFGFEVQVVSDSERAARYGGVRIRRKILAVMGISGAIAGIGGASQVGDFAHSLDGDPNGLQKLSYGYTGIVVAALARYNPFATCLIAFLIGGLENAGNTLQGADFPAGLVGVIQGIILFSALGGELLVRYRVRIGRPERTVAAPEAA